MNKVLFIPHLKNEDILKQEIDSLINQVDYFFIINNSLTPLSFIDSKIVDYIPSDSLCYEQSLNVAIRKSHELNIPTLWAHSDLIAHDSNVIDILIEKYEEIKNDKWGVIYACYDALCMFNPEFFYKENLWGDPWLFINYFGDNNRYRLMDLRGWKKYSVEDRTSKLVEHLGSQTIRKHPDMNRKNGLTFDLYGQLYKKIWGGLPGQETINDPTAKGLFP